MHPSLPQVAVHVLMYIFSLHCLALHCFAVNCLRGSVNIYVYMFSFTWSYRFDRQYCVRPYCVFDWA